MVEQPYVCPLVCKNINNNRSCVIPTHNKALTLLILSDSFSIFSSILLIRCWTRQQVRTVLQQSKLRTSTVAQKLCENHMRICTKRETVLWTKQLMAENIKGLTFTVLQLHFNWFTSLLFVCESVSALRST